MSKSFFLLALCIALIASIAVGQVTISWEQDHWKYGQPTVLKISTVDTQLSNLSFVFSTPLNLDFNNDEVQVYFAALGHNKDNNGRYPCVDSNDQLVAFVQSTNSYNFFITQTQRNVDDSITDGKYPNHELRCFIWHPNTQSDEPISVRITGQTGGANQLPITVELQNPVKGFIHPIIDFKSAKVSKKADSFVGSDLFEIEFTVDTVGIYNVTLFNGATPYPVNFSTGKFAPKYCSSGSNKEFAAIIPNNNGNAFIAVDNIPDSKSTIKCTFALSFMQALGLKVVNNQFYTQISMSNSAASLTTELPFHLSYSIAMGAITPTQMMLMIPVISLDIKTNSTVTFDFSNHFDVSYLVLSTGEQEYRGFRGQGFSATISVSGNSIILKDVLPNNNSSGFFVIVSQFIFAGQKLFRFKDNAKQGSVRVSVDGTAVDSLNSPGKDTQIYFGSSAELTKTSLVETESDGVITYVDSFTIRDEFDSNPITPSRGTLLIGLDGPKLFSEEDYSTQLQCKISSVSSTQLQDAKMKFIPSIRNWLIDLDVTSISKWDLQVQCTHKVPKIVQFGRNITPQTGLYVMYVDFIDQTRYNPNTYDLQLQTDPQKQTDKQTGTYPGKLLNYLNVTIDASLPYGNIKNNIEKSQSTVLGAMDKSVAQTGYTLTPIVQGSAFMNPGNSKYSYGDKSKHLNFVTYLDDVFATNGSFLTFSSPLPTADVSRLYDGSLEFGFYPSSPRVQYHQLYESVASDTAPSYDFNAFYKQLVDQFKTSKAHVDPVPVHDNNFSNTRINQYSFTKITGCGFDSIFFDTPFEAITDDADDEADQWSYFTSKNYLTQLCQIGQTCKYNADCLNGQCLGKVCVERPADPLPFIPVELARTSPEFMLNDYYNSAPVFSAAFALGAVFIALLF